MERSGCDQWMGTSSSLSSTLVPCPASQRRMWRTDVAAAAAEGVMGRGAPYFSNPSHRKRKTAGNAYAMITAGATPIRVAVSRVAQR